MNDSLSQLVLKNNSLTDLAVVYRYPDAEKKPLTFAKTKAASLKAHLIYDQCYKATYGKVDRSKFMMKFKV